MAMSGSCGERGNHKDIRKGAVRLRVGGKEVADLAARSDDSD